MSADARLAIDIGIAAADEGMRSIMLKIDTLPIELRISALCCALSSIAAKADVVARLPGLQGIHQTVLATVEAQAKDLAAHMDKTGLADLAVHVRSAAQ